MRRVLSVLSVLLAFTGLGIAAPAAHAVPGGGTQMWSGYAYYPRVVRLEHNGSSNGMVVAAVVTNQNGDWVGAVFHSTDNGRSYTQVGAVDDPVNSTGMCCQTLYELPSAVGGMPAGTLLWAASFGADAGSGRRMSIRVWRSNDLGVSWSYLSTVTTASSGLGLWEPELTVASDGRLVVFYSDETDPAHSQKLERAHSADGVTWTDFSDTVALGDSSARPGMAVVRRLPGGSYLMSYEVCGGSHVCEVYVRSSPDGWDWGTPSDIGTRVLTADGRYPASTPTITVAGHTVLLTAMRLRNPDGSFAAGDGRTVLGNAAGGQGPWFDVASPVPLSDAGGGPAPTCPGYSSPLLGSADGKSFLQVTTDLDASGQCRAYVGQASALPSGSTGSTWTAEGSQVYLSPNQQHFTDTNAGGALRNVWWDGSTGYAADTWATGVTGNPVTFADGTQQHVFVRGSNGSLQHYFRDSATGSTTHDTWAGSGLAGDPAAMTIGDAQHVWWVDSAGTLEHSWWDPAGGSHHDTWATGVTGRPSAMLVGDVQHVFVRTPTGAIRHVWWDAAQGSQSETVPADAAGDLAVAEIGDAQHLWFTDSAGRLQHWWWSPAAGWNNDTWGSGDTGRPAFLQDGAQQHVFVRGSGGTLEHYFWQPSDGLHHDTWGTGISGDPTALPIGDAQHVWATDPNGTVQHWWWDQADGLRHDSWGS
ncbi:hypothetical protein [Streptomyces misionensis]|uniref:hypothetical protein n=1 Tax=Streptomyces misionensis TaxID=67331 RepID=UPI0036FB7F28